SVWAFTSTDEIAANERAAVRNRVAIIPRRDLPVNLRIVIKFFIALSGLPVLAIMSRSLANSISQSLENETGLIFQSVKTEEKVTK
ncbi:MAG: hypothetical protein WKF34_12500, partial [Pyrinomonadaceae bacterium]